MTKDEALKMSLNYIETNAHERKYVCHAIKQALANNALESKAENAKQLGFDYEPNKGKEHIKHPATYTDAFFPIFAKLLDGKNVVLDPFAGTGKLALVKNFGFAGKVWCNELEPEWVKTSNHKVDKWNVGDACNLSWAVGVDAICTSPTYGNRMADSHNAKDFSRRITYTHYLGRKLTDGNSGAMQWGKKYKTLHESVWNECWKILAQDGLMIVNISNHIRKGVEVDVVDWHEKCLKEIGFEFVDHIKIQTPRMKFGKNFEKRILHESILVFCKLKKKNT